MSTPTSRELPFGMHVVEPPSLPRPPAWADIERRKAAVRMAARLAAGGAMPPLEAFGRALQLYAKDDRVSRALVAYVLDWFDLSHRTVAIDCDWCHQPTRRLSRTRPPQFCDRHEYLDCWRSRNAGAKSRQRDRDEREWSPGTIWLRAQGAKQGHEPKPI